MISYNILLTITSKSGELNQKIYEEFDGRTNLELKDAPKSLRALMQNMNHIFPLFEKNPERAMLFLKKLNQALNQQK